VTIFNKRNALLGFVTWKALQLRRKPKQRSPLKIAAFVALGVVSAGILAAILAVALRRNGHAGDELDAEAQELTDELEAELEAAVPEPGFAE
jgi:hypothetical protein